MNMTSINDKNKSLANWEEVLWVKECLFNIWCWNDWITNEKVNFFQYLTPYTKNIWDGLHRCIKKIKYLHGIRERLFLISITDYNKRQNWIKWEIELKNFKIYLNPKKNIMQVISQILRQGTYTSKIWKLILTNSISTFTDIYIYIKTLFKKDKIFEQLLQKKWYLVANVGKVVLEYYLIQIKITIG